MADWYPWRWKLLVTTFSRHRRLQQGKLPVLRCYASAVMIPSQILDTLADRDLKYMEHSDYSYLCVVGKRKRNYNGWASPTPHCICILKGKLSLNLLVNEPDWDDSKYATTLPKLTRAATQNSSLNSTISNRWNLRISVSLLPQFSAPSSFWKICTNNLNVSDFDCILFMKKKKKSQQQNPF